MHVVKVKPQDIGWPLSAKDARGLAVHGSIRLDRIAIKVLELTKPAGTEISQERGFNGQPCTCAIGSAESRDAGRINPVRASIRIHARRLNFGECANIRFSSTDRTAAQDKLATVPERQIMVC